MNEDQPSAGRPEILVRFHREHTVLPWLERLPFLSGKLENFPFARVKWRPGELSIYRNTIVHRIFAFTFLVALIGAVFFPPVLLVTLGAAFLWLNFRSYYRFELADGQLRYVEGFHGLARVRLLGPITDVRGITATSRPGARVNEFQYRNVFWMTTGKLEPFGFETRSCDAANHLSRVIGTVTGRPSTDCPPRGWLVTSITGRYDDDSLSFEIHPDNGLVSQLKQVVLLVVLMAIGTVVMFALAIHLS